MRTYDKIVTRIITVLLISMGLAFFITILKLNQYFEHILAISEIFVFLLGFSIVINDFNRFRNERKIIHSRLNDLQSKGLRVYRKKFERLLYSRDIADLPKLGKLLHDFGVIAVLQPTTHQEIKDIIKLCEDFTIPIIPRGAGTGGYGGGLPTQNGFILVLTQIKEILSIDKENNSIEVESGITWRRLREYLRKNKYDLFTYPSSAPSSSVGGWVASGGYGIGSSKYGEVSQSIQSVTILGTNGGIFHLDNPSDFVGNFGTLGIIWKVSLKIRERSPFHHVVIRPKSKNINVTTFNRLQTMNPYYLRHIDQKSLRWITGNNEVTSNFKNAKSGVIVASFLESDWIIFQEDARKFDNILSDSIANELWDDRFYTLRLKRGGPSIIVSEIIVPSDALGKFLEALDNWFMQEKYAVEVISVSPHSCMVMVWFPTDQRKHSLPLVGSLPYLVHWFRSFQVIRIAWSVGGSTYNNGGLWLAPYPNKENLPQIVRIKKMKKRTDPNEIFNPGKIGDSKIPRF
ncbi:MAG: FAD-binding oxidoreductase, partial [Candidatus Hodarchaeales archaeon]